MESRLNYGNVEKPNTQNGSAVLVLDGDVWSEGQENGELSICSHPGVGGKKEPFILILEFT